MISMLFVLIQWWIDREGDRGIARDRWRIYKVCIKIIMRNLLCFYQINVWIVYPVKVFLFPWQFHSIFLNLNLFEIVLSNDTILLFPMQLVEKTKNIRWKKLLIYYNFRTIKFGSIVKKIRWRNDGRSTWIETEIRR